MAKLDKKWRGKAGARREGVEGPQDIPKSGIKIDWGLVQRLAERQIPITDICDILAVSESTLRRAHMRDHGGEALQVLIGYGKAMGRFRLRQLQWQSATKGNVRMQIFLGKNILGQSEAIKVSLDRENRIETHATVDMAKLSTSALKEIIAAAVDVAEQDDDTDENGKV